VSGHLSAISQQLSSIYIEHSTRLPHLPGVQQSSINLQPFGAYLARSHPFRWHNDSTRDKRCSLYIATSIDKGLKDPDSVKGKPSDDQTFDIANTLTIVYPRLQL
jgi:hypothetical protein